MIAEEIHYAGSSRFLGNGFGSSGLQDRAIRHTDWGASENAPTFSTMPAADHTKLPL